MILPRFFEECHIVLMRSKLCTLIEVVFLHGADEVGPGVEVVWPRLLEASQAEEAPVVGGAAGKGPPAGDAGVTCPALHLQVKSLQRRHRHLPLPAAWRGQETRS